MDPRGFGKYTLLHRIARGGMAELYLARSHEVAGIERLLVVKLVASRFSLDREFASMFEDEARTASHLNHPNIVQLIEVGQVHDAYFMAMEHIHGRNLRQVLKRCLERGTAVPFSVAVPMAVKVCAGLHHAHNAQDCDGRALKIVHRDVSPTNLMMSFEGQVKLIDFGIARLANRAAITVPGTIKGKLRYLSPEQVLNRQLDRRTDVFGLGVCLWELTVGQHCFDGASDAHIYEVIAKAQVRPPSSLIQDYPPGLERVLMRALALRPEDRYPTAQALQCELENFAEQSGISLSDLALARFMHDTFAPELAAWELARRKGISLADHLQQVEVSAEEAAPVMLVSGARTARAPGLPTLPVTMPEPVASPPDRGAPRRTVIYGDLPPEVRTTLPYPTLTSVDQGQATPALAPTPASAPAPAPALAPTPALAPALAPAPTTELDPEPAGAEQRSEPAEVAGSRRRTVLVGTGLLSGPGGEQPNTPAPSMIDSRQPEVLVVRPGSEQRGQDGPIDSATKPDPKPADTVVDAPEPISARPGTLAAVNAPEPIIARDRQELSAQRRQLQEASSAAALRPDSTNPWSADPWSAEADADVRPQTHPYFRNEPDDLPFRPVGARRPLLLMLVPAACLAVAVGLVAWWQSGRHSSRSSAPAAAKIAVAEVESEPNGAILFDLDSGRELGTTPVRLELPRNGSLRLEVQRPGYRRFRMLIEREGHYLANLVAERRPPDASAAPVVEPPLSAPGPKTKPPLAAKRRSRPQIKKHRPAGDLVDPFQ